jgi:hypothetical protein
VLLLGVSLAVLGLFLVALLGEYVVRLVTLLGAYAALSCDRFMRYARGAGTWAGMNRKQRLVLVSFCFVLAVAFVVYNFVYLRYHYEYMRPAQFFWGLVVPGALVVMGTFVMLGDETL